VRVRTIAIRVVWGLLLASLAATRSPERTTTRLGSAEGWNRFYASVDVDDPRWQPNALLVEVTRGLEPGRALDIGMGQGRNALYLAEQGWRVTGIDVSTVALRLARRQARERGVELDVEQADMWRYELGIERWDLIVCSYLNGLEVVRAEQIKRSLASDGVLVVEGFVLSEELAARGYPNLGFESGTLLDAYADLDILQYEQVRAPADWYPGEVLPLVRLVARKQ
jgi:SAM-dependent methyltransferase